MKHYENYRLVHVQDARSASPQCIVAFSGGEAIDTVVRQCVVAQEDKMPRLMQYHRLHASRGTECMRWKAEELKTGARDSVEGVTEVRKIGGARDSSRRKRIHFGE